MNKWKVNKFLVGLIILLVGVLIGVTVVKTPGSADVAPITGVSKTDKATSADSIKQSLDFDKLFDTTSPDPSYTFPTCAYDQGWPAQVDANGGAVKIHFTGIGNTTFKMERDAVKSDLQSYLNSQMSSLNNQLLNYYQGNWGSREGAEYGLQQNMSLFNDKLGVWLAGRSKNSLSKVKNITLDDAVEYYQTGIKWSKGIRMFAGDGYKLYDYSLNDQDFDANVNLSVLGQNPGLNVSAKWKLGGDWRLHALYDPCPGLGITTGGVSGLGRHTAKLEITAPGVKLTDGSIITVKGTINLKPTGAMGMLNAGYKF